MIVAYQGKPADAERLPRACRPAATSSSRTNCAASGFGLGFGYLQDKKPANARAIFERLAKDKPEQPDAHTASAARCPTSSSGTPRSPNSSSPPRCLATSRCRSTTDSASRSRPRATASRPGRRSCATSRPRTGIRKNVEDAKKRLAELG